MIKLKTFIPHLFLCFTLCMISCTDHKRPVVPCDEDIDEIFTPLSPNDEEGPANLTFGEAQIPGFTKTVEMTTENPEVYVYLDNLTLLDVNPSVIQKLLEFVQDTLAEYGFISDSVTLAPDEFEQLLGQGLNYEEASDKIIDTLKNEFEEQMTKNGDLSYPFNAHFQIYPLYLTDKLITFRLAAYCYTGGAHGMSISYVTSYDLSSGKTLTFNDLVLPDATTAVREEVAAHMAYSYPIYENISTVDEYIDSLNVWLDNFSTPDKDKDITLKDFPVSDAALVSRGLVCIYQMYELTPGSDGCPVVVIPYKDIAGCLNPEYSPNLKK